MCYTGPGYFCCRLVENHSLGRGHPQCFLENRCCYPLLLNPNLQRLFASRSPGICRCLLLFFTFSLFAFFFSSSLAYINRLASLSYCSSIVTRASQVLLSFFFLFLFVYKKSNHSLVLVRYHTGKGRHAHTCVCASCYCCLAFLKHWASVSQRSRGRVSRSPQWAPCIHLDGTSDSGTI